MMTAQDEKAAAEAAMKTAQDEKAAAEAAAKTAQDMQAAAEATARMLGDDLQSALHGKAKAEKDLKAAQDDAQIAKDDLSAAQEAVKAAEEAKTQALADKETAEQALADAQVSAGEPVTAPEALDFIVKGGYRVITVSKQGYIGPIEVTVILDANGAIQAMAVDGYGFTETYGVGDKVREADFISQFIGKSGTVELGQDIDAVSGATASSQAVVDAVNEALSQLK